MSTPITGLTNLGTPQPTMSLYAALSPFGVTDDRKITANALLATITANISDVSLQFDNGQATATVSAAGKGKIRYNNLTGTFQQSINGAAYVDIGGGGAGTPGAPLNSVQYNAGAGVFGGNAGFLYTPAASPNISIENASVGDTPVWIKQDTAGAIVSVGGASALLNLQQTTSAVGLQSLVNDGASHRWSHFINNTGGYSGQLVWEAYDLLNAFHGINAFHPTGGFIAFSDDGLGLLFIDQALGTNMGAIWADVDVFKLGVTPNTGGLGTPTQVLSWVSSGIVTLGVASTLTGSLALANSASAFLTTITAGNAAAARTYVWPTNFGAAGSALTDAAGDGILSWVVSGSGSGTVNAGTQYQIAYYPASAAAVSGLSTLNTDASNRILFSAASILVPVAIADAAPIATNAALGNRFTVSSAVDRTLGIPTNPTNGQQCSWSWTNTAGAPHTLTLTTGSAGAFRYNGTITVLPTTAAGKKLMFTAVYDLSADRWDVQGYVNDI